MRLNNWILCFFLMVLSSGCIEPFEPDIEESSEVLVIDGLLTDSQGTQTISISRSSPYSSPQFRPVTGCVVRVEDDAGSGITFLEKEEGIYQSVPEPDFLAVGKAYKLLVITPEDEVYESEYDSLLACAPIDHLSYRLEVQGTSDPDIFYYGIRFYVDVKGNPEESRNYMWTFEETWEYQSYYPIQFIWDGIEIQTFNMFLYGFSTCYMTSKLDNFDVGSTSLAESNIIHQQPLHFVSNLTPRLQEQYSLLVAQHSLSYGAFLYWEKMRAQASDTGGLFETQPSSSRGNIYNINNPEEKVLGYFYTSQVKEKRITVRENFDFPIPRFECPLDTANSLEDFGVDYPYYMYANGEYGPPFYYSNQECHNCTHRGGVTTKPEYWDD